MSTVKANRRLRHGDLVEFPLRPGVVGIREEGNFLVQTDDTVITWSNGAALITGYSDEEIIGRRFSCLFVAEDRKRGYPDEIVREAATQHRFDGKVGVLERTGPRTGPIVCLQPCTTRRS